MELNINYFCQEKLLLFRLKRQQCGFIHAPSVVLFSPMATSKHFSIIECSWRNGSTIVLLQSGRKKQNKPQQKNETKQKKPQKSSKVKEILSHSVGCLIHYLIICVFISIDLFFFFKTDGEKITCNLLNTGTITAGAFILYRMNNAIHKRWKFQRFVSCC